MAKRNPFALYDGCEISKITKKIRKILEEGNDKCLSILRYEMATKLFLLKDIGCGIGDTQTDEAIVEEFGKIIAQSLFQEIRF